MPNYTLDEMLDDTNARCSRLEIEINEFKGKYHDALRLRQQDLDRIAQLEPANALLQDQVCALANRKDQLEAALSASKIEFLQQWMRAPNPMLGGAVPLDMMFQGMGRRVAQFIDSAYQSETACESPWVITKKQAIEPTHEAADAFWKYWRENGDTHKHGYYESTWGAINAALNATSSDRAGKHDA